MKVLKSVTQTIEEKIIDNEKVIEYWGTASSRVVLVSWQELLFLCQDALDSGLLSSLTLRELRPLRDDTKPEFLPVLGFPRTITELPPALVDSADKEFAVNNLMQCGHDLYDIWFRGYKLKVVG